MGVDIWSPLMSMLMPMSDVNLDMLEQVIRIMTMIIINYNNAIIIQWSSDFYPDLYCGCIEATETACLEQSIVELWADQVRGREMFFHFVGYDLCNGVRISRLHTVFWHLFSIVS